MSRYNALIFAKDNGKVILDDVIFTIPADLPSTDDTYIRYTLTVADDTAQAITPAAFKIIGTVQEPISGLTAANKSPIVLGETTLFTASTWF